MKPFICFIDDSGFEHDLVRDEIAPCGPDLVFIQAFTFEEAREKLGAKVHGLFLLDLWGKDEEVREPHISSKEELERRIAHFPTLDHVYEGLDDFKGVVFVGKEVFARGLPLEKLDDDYPHPPPGRP